MLNRATLTLTGPKTLRLNKNHRTTILQFCVAFIAYRLPMQSFERSLHHEHMGSLRTGGSVSLRKSSGTSMPYLPRLHSRPSRTRQIRHTLWSPGIWDVDPMFSAVTTAPITVHHRQRFVARKVILGAYHNWRPRKKEASPLPPCCHCHQQRSGWFLLQ